jgi:hypothetical protein
LPASVTALRAVVENNREAMGGVGLITQQPERSFVSLIGYQAQGSATIPID